MSFVKVLVAARATISVNGVVQKKVRKRTKNVTLKVPTGGSLSSISVGLHLCTMKLNSRGGLGFRGQCLMKSTSVWMDEIPLSENSTRCRESGGSTRLSGSFRPFVY